jgi:VCBS repeat-containing protein
VNDGSLTSPAATVSITVTVVNDAPVAAGQSQTTAEDAALVLTLAATDVDNASLTFAVGTAPTHGTLGTMGAPSCTPSGGGTSCTAQVTYTPNANYNGADTFTFTASDGSLTSPAATVNLTVTAVNDRPAAADQGVTTAEDAALAVTLSGTDIDSASLTFAIGTNPIHGSLGTQGGPSCTPSGGGTSCTAQVIYTPAADYNGPDSFTFTVYDGSLTSLTGTISVTVTPVNDAPVANADAYSTAEDTLLTVPAPGVLSNDTDVDTPNLTAILVSGPTHGNLTLNSDGSFSYTPNSNFNGSDSFTYKANDGSLDSNVATVSLTITALNDAPVANGQGVTTLVDTPVTITLAGNDVDGDSLTFAIGTSPTQGTLGTIGTPTCAAGSCTATVTYSPNAGYTGADSFTFTVNDGSLNSTAATVGITVNP